MEQTNKILFILLILFLSTVVLTSAFRAKELVKLRGKYKAVDRPIFSIQDWLSGSYQMKMDKRTNSRFFLRSVLIKCKSQIEYDLFDKTKGDWIIKGKDNMLFDRKYISAYQGQNFIGKDSIEHRVKLLKFVQDTLQAKGKKFLVVIAPNKAAIYPEYFPPKYSNAEKKLSTYDYYIDQLSAYDIGYIDFNKMFMDMKDTVRYPLYSKQGTHWNNYTYQFAWNTIVDSLEQDMNWKLARLQPGKINLESPKGRDRDLEHLLNIFSVQDTSRVAYVDYTIDTIDIDHPTGLVIADSYFWGLRTLGFSRTVLNGGMYWYYNNTAYPAEDDVLYTPQEYNFNRVIEDVDMVMILATAANLDLFPFGFEEDFHEAMHTPPTEEELKKRNKELVRMMERIKKNDEWYGNLKLESVEKQQPLDSIVRVAAEYFLKKAKEDKAKKE